MNGAESLVKTLVGSGVEVVFANPGTSEMHFVAALDREPAMRCILCLFEGGTSGAADGYWRMARKPAATLLHLAPGFGNAFANLHNARKARSGIVNVMGEHATWHLAQESPLKGDTEGISRAVSHWTRVSREAGDVAGDGAEAVRAAKGGQIATLILPANTAWEEGAEPVVAGEPARPRMPREDEIAAAAAALAEPGAALMVDGEALWSDLGLVAARIAARTGARLMAPFFTARQRRGAGSLRLTRLAYEVDPNRAILADVKTLVLVGAQRPTAFFAYPGKPSLNEAPGTKVLALASLEMDVAGTLHALEAAVGAEGVDLGAEAFMPLALPAVPDGVLTLDKVGQAIAALMPAEAVVVNEAVTSGAPIAAALATARGHDWLVTMGGAIGACLPTAVGVAVACAGRKVLALSGDGSAMYTLQSLWTMAREGLDVTVVVFANHVYKILHGELANVGATAGRNVARMFDMVEPKLDWVALASGHGVQAVHCTTTAEFVAAFGRAMAEPGPHLIAVEC